MSRRATSQRFSPWFSAYAPLNVGMSIAKVAAYTLLCAGLLVVGAWFVGLFLAMFTEQAFPAFSLQVDSLLRSSLDLYFVRSLFLYVQAWAIVFAYFLALLVLRGVFNTAAGATSRVRTVVGGMANR